MIVGGVEAAATVGPRLDVSVGVGLIVSSNSVDTVEVTVAVNRVTVPFSCRKVETGVERASDGKVEALEWVSEGEAVVLGWIWDNDAAGPG